MSAKLKADRVRRKYEFIKAHRKQFPTDVMCRELGVAPSGYYQWLKCPQSARAVEDARLLRLIRASFTASQGIYGAPRVFLDLRDAGETCSKHRVARLMRENGLRALHGYRTRRWEVGKPAVLTPNLLKRQFSPTQPNAAQRRLGDGHHVHPDVAGVALPRGRDRPVLPQGGRVGHWTDDPPRTGLERARISRQAAAAVGDDHPLRSGHAIRQRYLATILPIQSPGAEHEPQRQLLGSPACRRPVAQGHHALSETLHHPRTLSADPRRPRLHPIAALT